MADAVADGLVGAAANSDAGTDEARWRGWPFLERLPRVQAPGGRVVVVSAHPDDEVLGAGGLIATLDEDAPEPLFVTATDGEASHPEAPASVTRDLASRRSLELVDALHALGHQAPVVQRLRLPDSALSEHVDELDYRLQRIVRGADLVLCPSADDGHPDHAVVGAAVRAVCAGLVPVWEFPIWIWHWTGPEDPRTPWHRACRLDLPTEAQRRKRRALMCFTSQIAPLGGVDVADTILPPEVLEHFARPYEVFFR